MISVRSARRKPLLVGWSPKADDPIFRAEEEEEESHGI